MIYISYSSKDDYWANKVYSKLINWQIDKANIFLDIVNINESDQFVNLINEKLENARIFIVIVSNNYSKSNWQKRELQYAISKSTNIPEIKLFIINIDKNFNHSELPPLNSTEQTIDCTEELKFESVINILIKSIYNVKASPHYLFDLIEKLYLPKESILENYSEEYFESYKKVFSFVLSIENEQNDNSESVFTFLKKHILTNQDNNPITIEGKPGTGKTSFLIVLYHYFKTLFINKEFDFFPVFISLDNYNNANNKADAIQRLRDDLVPIELFLNKENSIKVLFIIDGLDNYYKFKVDINSVLIQYISQLHSIKKIIGVSYSGYKFFKRNVNNIQIIPSYKIKTNSININSKESKDFISELYFAHRREEISTEFYKELVSFFKSIKLYDLDFFILSFIIKNQDLWYGNRKELKSIASLFQLYSEHRLEFQGISLEFTSKLAFDYYINEKSIEFNNEHFFKSWSIINYHNSFRDFFIANNIISNIIQLQELDNITKNDLEIFNHVYQDQVNKYCKLILNEDDSTQTVVINQIIKVFDNCGLFAQTHFCYLLGRVDNSNLKNKCQIYLFDLKRKLFNRDYKKGEIELKYKDKKYLLLLRTIFISLANLGNKPAAIEYIEMLSDDAKWDQINRGFHLEYYGDIPFAPKDGDILMLEDDGYRPIEITFNKLINRLYFALTKNQAPNLFAIELYTICSLIQHRQVYNSENDICHYINMLNSYINKLLSVKPHFVPESIKRYLIMLQQHFAFGNKFYYGDIMDKILNIKNEKRRGWIDDGREIDKKESVETVASHTLGTVYIAKFLLPENYVDEDSTHFVYNKNKIIEILLYHDITEAYLGDEISHKKTSTYRGEEIKIINYISQLSSYVDLGNFKDIYVNWLNFENDFEEVKDINFKIAKDIDKIDNIYQLLYYGFNDKNKIPDFVDFFSNLYLSIKTNLGIKIRDIIIAPHKDVLISKYPVIYALYK